MTIGSVTLNMVTIEVRDVGAPDSVAHDRCLRLVASDNSTRIMSDLVRCSFSASRSISSIAAGLSRTWTVIRASDMNTP
jgi:hypothetical protein